MHTYTFYVWKEIKLDMNICRLELRQKWKYILNDEDEEYCSVTPCGLQTPHVIWNWQLSHTAAALPVSQYSSAFQAFLMSYHCCPLLLRQMTNWGFWFSAKPNLVCCLSLLLPCLSWLTLAFSLYIRLYHSRADCHFKESLGMVFPGMTIIETKKFILLCLHWD